MAPVDAAPRLLVRRLHRIMAEPDGDQTRLNNIVRMVATLMIAEVCSIYLNNRDGSLELFATEGLKPEAVHNTHLKRGEGLVGLIAERGQPVNVTDAPTHPAFSFRPETGEEAYHSFLGVPITCNGRVLGVLTIQNRTTRQYTDEEVEALQTTAMVLAEHLSSHDGPKFDEDGRERSDRGGERILVKQLSPGIALGHIVLHQPRIVVKELIAENPNQERVRLDEAVIKMRATIDAMLQRGDLAALGEHHDVLEVYRMFAHDRGWIKRMRDAIERGLTAEAAVDRVRNDMRANMLNQSDPYWRERLQDFDDLSDRLMRILAGEAETAAAEELPDDALLVARTMGPAELLDYDPAKLRGLIVEEGGYNSHVAIVARAMGIPATGEARGIISRLEEGNAAIIDADAGEIHIRPGSDIIDAYSDKVRFQARKQKRYDDLRNKPAVTLDGEHISLHMNAGLLVDLPHLHESGAEGIGLFRTELQFMVSSTIPRLRQQTEFYREILEVAGDKPVIFRALDIGGDKLLPYLRHTHEDNPALGWRAIRMSLDRPGLFRMQVRALLHASAGKTLNLMLPMVTEVWELEKARELIEFEHKRLKQFDRKEPDDIKIGVMIEVPAIMWHLDDLFKNVDFASVGSNDLLQFLFAADRSNINVADRYDALTEPAIRSLKRIIDHAEKHKTPLELCGEMAGRPIEAMALIGLGYKTISMPPASIGPIKSMVRKVNYSDLKDIMAQCLNDRSNCFRARLEDYAKSKGIEF